MNTLKMKVLLILSNRYLFRATGKAILVWLSANLMGCAILYGLGFFFLQSPVDFITALILSLIFSSPAVLIAAWVVYVLPSFSNIFKRTLLSLASILATSAFIIWIVAEVFGLEYIEVARVLYPFTLAAIACFFLIVRKQITSTVYFK
jgi:hypothetical protein